MAELITAVFARDPDRPGAKPMLFLPGDDVPERFWPRLSGNPALWRDGKPPAPTGDTDDDENSATPSSDADHDPDTAPSDSGDEEPAKKPAARKAAPKTGSRRRAADEGTGGQ